MTTLREAAQQMLEEAEENQYAVSNQAPHSDVMSYNAAILNLRAALIREDEASAWLDERKEHWRKEREKAQTTKDQDPELSAALGWPGGISDPVLDRVQLLRMVAALMQDKLWEDHRVKHLWDHAQEQAKTCAWRDNLDAIYETECGNLYIVNDGTPEENGMKYCCYCGKEIKDESPT